MLIRLLVRGGFHHLRQRPLIRAQDQLNVTGGESSLS